MLNFTTNEILAIRNILSGSDHSQVDFENGTFKPLMGVGKFTQVTTFGDNLFIDNSKLLAEGVIFTDNDFIPSLQKLFCGKISPEITRISTLLQKVVDRAEAEGIFSFTMFVNVSRSFIGYEIKPNCVNGSYLYCSDLPTSELFTWSGMEFTTLFEMGKEVNKMIPVDFLKSHGVINPDILCVDYTNAKTLIMMLTSL